MLLYTEVYIPELFKETVPWIEPAATYRTLGVYLSPSGQTSSSCGSKQYHMQPVLLAPT
jgi:hypothetical protein